MSIITEEVSNPKLNDDQYRKSVMELFESVDKDGNGLVSVNELKNYLQVIGYNPSKEEVIKMVEDADKTNKGALSKIRSYEIRF